MSTVESRTITSYDVLKTLGVITFLLDHLGLYFWPEAEMLRVLGRLSAPIWFFLIGYAKTRDVPFAWVFWLAADLMVSAALGMEIRPSILLTLILARLSIDAIGPLLYPRSQFTMAFLMFCLVMNPLVVPFLPYGSYAWALVAVGYWTRRDGITGMSWIAAVLFGYFAIQSFAFDFSEPALLVFVGGMMCVTAALMSFKPDATMVMKSGLSAGLYRFCGHYSLVIFSIHLILFKIIHYFVY